MKVVNNRLFALFATLVLIVLTVIACTPNPYAGINTETNGWDKKQIFTKFADMLNNPTPQNSKLTAKIKLSMDSGNDGWTDIFTDMTGIAADGRIYLQLSMKVDEYLYSWEDDENEPGVSHRVQYLDKSEKVSAEIWMDVETGDVAYSVDTDDRKVDGNYNLYSELTPEEMQQLEQYLEELQQLSETHEDVMYEDVWNYLKDSYQSMEVYTNDSSLSKVKLVLSSDYILQQGVAHKPNTTVYVVFNNDGTFRYKVEEDGYLGVVGNTTLSIESVTEVVPTKEKVQMPSFK